VRRFYGVARRAAVLQGAVEGIAASYLTGGVTTRSAVAASPGPVAAELMRQLYSRAGGVEPSLSRAHIAAMLRLAQPGRGGRGVDLPGGLRLRIVGEFMQVIAEKTALNPAPKLEVSSCAGCDDPIVVHLKPELVLHLGYRRPGLTMRPLGGRGTRKLQDIFVDARVPREDRDTWPLVFAGESLAVVPGIAVAEDMASRPGEPALHVTVVGIPAKVELLNSFPGETS
ncbi:MAG TPA: tRNA lysidine(34) synthetase TilS, partial [Candidatus Dormibacteraeota bacterium]|nr:tRNA lysidine(34) synthetase TilS [Candidatus Dormibacteraeota bacterium]